MARDPALVGKPKLLAELAAVDSALDQLGAPRSAPHWGPTGVEGLAIAGSHDLTRVGRLRALVQRVARGDQAHVELDQARTSEIRRLQREKYEATWGADSLVVRLMDALQPIIDHTGDDADIFRLTPAEREDARLAYHEAEERHTLETHEHEQEEKGLLP